MSSLKWPTGKNQVPSSSSLRKAIHAHLLKIGFSRNHKRYAVNGELTKEKIRQIHSAKRIEVLDRNVAFIKKYGAELISHFATGSAVNPDAINPELIEVLSGSPESRLFRFACLLWSAPVSQGFGRRLRFLIRDRSNGYLMGLFAIGDPVFNLSARDKWIGWNHEDRMERLVHVMDAYVVGAVPPYSKIIGGKLVASLIASEEVKTAYERKYVGLKSVITKKDNRAKLVLLTTTSALGRSSLYNRLKIPDGPRFIPIGMTRGFGHFHLSGEIFALMRNYLETVGHPYASGHQFGMGPNWRIRVARAAIEMAGLDGDSILNHGIARQVYAVPLAKNWKEILLGQQRNVYSCPLPAAQISEYCLNRWMLPRAARDKSFKRFARCRIMEYLLDSSQPPAW